VRYVASVAAQRSLADLQNIHTRLGKAQDAATSGLKHSVASEDPTWYDTQTRTNASLQRNAQFNKNLSAAQGRLERSDGVLDQATSIVTRLQELSVQMANGTYNAVERADAGNEVASLKASMLQLANERDGDGFLFGGYTSQTAPYDAAGNFVGDGSDRTTSVGVGQTAISSVSGQAAFDFAIFDTVSAAMNANDPVAIAAALPGVQSALDKGVQARAIVGDRMNILDRQATRIAAEDTATQNERVRTVETDPIAAYSEISQATSALESALKVSAQSMHQSLFDYL
jgi:flagellar hook-associated protein 3 FlgL